MTSYLWMDSNIAVCVDQIFSEVSLVSGQTRAWLPCLICCQGSIHQGTSWCRVSEAP